MLRMFVAVLAIKLLRSRKLGLEFTLYLDKIFDACLISSDICSEINSHVSCSLQPLIYILVNLLRWNKAEHMFKRNEYELQGTTLQKVAPLVYLCYH